MRRDIQSRLEIERVEREKRFTEAENALRAQDNDILEWKELRNNLEAYSYEMRSNLDSYGTFEKYLAEP